MPRYYFDLRDEDEVAVDEEGLELSSLRAVQIEAAKSLADLARDALHSSFIVPGIRHSGRSSRPLRTCDARQVHLGLRDQST
jgi:hypothetical protein